MHVTTIGAGYVGLVTSACLAEIGHNVTTVEIDRERLASLQSGEVPIFEPGLKEMINRNRAAGRLHFTADLEDGCRRSAIIVLAVGTPPRASDGHADLRHVHVAAEQIATCAAHGSIVVTKSTVPVGTGDEIERIMRAVAPEKRLSVASSPEFLREGAAIRDFMAPDRIVIGSDERHAVARLEKLFEPIIARGSTLLVTSRRSAELIKYAANAFLATKIGFINEIADLCEAVGADVADIADGIGLDSRIGRKFLNAGPGFGGSCFPKDTLALLKTAQDAGVPLRIVETLISVNDQRRRAMARKVIRLAGGSVRGKCIAILGLTFKPDTDDMREAPSIALITALQDAGASVRAYDPQGMERARQFLRDVTYAPDAETCLAGADLAVHVTEWLEFRALSPERIRDLLAQPIFIDLRNVFDPTTMRKAGIRFESVGRGDRPSPQTGRAAGSHRRSASGNSRLPLLELASAAE